MKKHNYNFPRIPPIPGIPWNRPDPKFLWYRKKIHHIQDQRPSVKCAHRERGCTLIEVCTHIYYLFPIGNEFFFSPQSLHISLSLLNLEFTLITTKIVTFSIMLDHCENEIIRIRIRITFFAKGGSLVFKAFNLFQIHNYIQDSKLALEERKYGCDGVALKG